MAAASSTSPMRPPLEAAVRGAKPAVVVNCAAWTAVDDAETHEDAALQVNGHAVAGLAAACADYGGTLVQLSTDYVFDGTASSPTGRRPAAARTAYGRSKLAGERAVLDLLAGDGGSGYVVRTAWLYGAHGPNFVRTMMDLERRSPPSTSLMTSAASPAGRSTSQVRSSAFWAMMTGPRLTWTLSATGGRDCTVPFPDFSSPSGSASRTVSCSRADHRRAIAASPRAWPTGRRPYAQRCS